MRIGNKKTYKKKTFNKRKPKNTVKKNKATRTKKRKIVKGGGEKTKKRKKSEESEESENECAICFEKFNDPDNPDITLSCKHTFHINCINNTCKHVSGHCKCPLCRAKLTSVDLNAIKIAAPPPPPPEPPNLVNMDEFKEYINDILRPTRHPLEKLKYELGRFLITTNLPVELYDDVAMEFELVKIRNSQYYKYRFTKIINLNSIPFFRSNKKYFRYIDYYNAGQSENDEDIDIDMIMAYDVYEV
jgi:hypothetical protein